MLLSRLEITGFKSFPERTVIELDGGITGVVGPNGCGKSNILDSIRWVLGEQRTSVLRSSRMEQIIFSGTSTLRPTGMAEVTLSIKNNRGLLPVEYDDLSITRRLYRSGDSEYLINKNVCRLKDIIELFFDTGMGANAYSVIQQGMIDAILSDKTEDRRSLFEEAAGVTKYKHRKKEAENKLAATEADLLRLGDVVSEIEKQVVTLRRQAKRATRYSQQRDRLKEIECARAAARIYESKVKFDSLSGTKGKLTGIIESVNADISRLQIELQEKKLRLTELEKEASSFRQRESDITLKAAGFENEIKIAESRIEVSKEEIETCRIDISALEKRIEMLRDANERNDTRLVEIESQKKSSAETCESLERELEKHTRELIAAEENLNSKRDSHLSISERISGLKTEISYLEETKKGLDSKLSDIERNTRDFDKIRTESDDSLTELEKQRGDIASKIENLQKENRLLSERKESSTEELNGLRDKLARLRAEESGLEARRELFEQMMETGEGFTSGARALRNWTGAPRGIHSSLAEILEVPEQYRVAVAAALGDMGEVMAVDDYSDAYAAIEYLKSSAGGRASFLVLSRIGQPDSDISRPKDGNGFLGYLDELVGCPDILRPAVRLLLGRVGLFESKEAAMNAGDQWDQFTRVTRDGLSLVPPGFISGGKTSTGVLGKKQDLSAVKDRLAVISSEKSGYEDDINKIHETIASLSREYAEKSRAINDAQEEQGSLGARFNQLKFDFKEQETRYISAVDESERLKAELVRIEERLRQLIGNHETLDTEARNSSTVLEEADTSVEELRSAIRGIEAKLTAARIKNVELDGLSERLKSEIEHNRELGVEASRMIEVNRQNMEKADKAISDSLEKIENIKSSLESSFDQRNEVKVKLNEFDGEIGERMSEISGIDDHIADKRKEKESLVSELHSLDMQFMELDSTRNSVLEKLKLEFRITALEAAPLPEGQTAESLAERAENIRESLRRMEPVNLMAAEDYERENDRLQFLIRQRDDLNKARASLREAISRINTTAENRFNDTFGKIAENFQRVFVSLFEGGEAKVELENPDDPLESPIKISARPGGKKMLTVTQLSGGERALTAISLLFGIYLVKPSPFCILDEVDAPLDDANLLRFLKLIKDFSKNTQFIIITHNKLTMEAADVLYGVTMQQPGVSQVVSVKFKGNGNGDGSQE